jgi:hypothetical protein
MASLTDFLRPFAEPLTPYLRDRIERALPDGARLGNLTIDGASVTVEDLVFEGSGARVTITRARARIAARGLVRSDSAEAVLEMLEGQVTLGEDGPLAPITFELRYFPSGRGTHWVDGRIEAKAAEHDLSVTGELEVGRGGVFLDKVRVSGPKSALVGSLRSRAALDSFRSPKLEGALEGTLAPADFPVRSSPLDLRDLRLTTTVSFAGTRARPEVEIVARSSDVPIRSVGQKRFLPHLRLTSLQARARFAAGALSADVSTDVEGGGTLSARAERGAEPSARARVDVTLARVAEGPLRHLLTLSGVTGLRWEQGVVDGEIALLAPVDAREGELELSGELRAVQVDIGLAKAIFPLVGPKLSLSGSTRSPALELTAQVDGGAFALTYGGHLDEPGEPELSLQSAGPRVLARLSAADPTMTPFVVEGDAHDDRDIVLPSSFRIGLTARPSPSALVADVVLTAEETTIEARLRTERGEHRGSRLSGSLSPKHARVLFSLAERAPEVGLGGKPIVFDLALSGPADKASLLGTVSSERLDLRGFGRSITLERANARVHVAPTFVAFEGASAELGRGRLSASGLVRTGSRESLGYVGRVHAIVDDVRVARDELFPEGAPIDGRLFAHAKITLSPASAEFPRGSARTEVFAKLTEPSYEFVPDATARLVRLGLPSVPTAGDAPLEAHAVFEDGLVRIHEVRASVPGLRLEGRVELRPETRSLSADARVTVERAWLSRSRVLALPGALLGQVTVPVAVRGSFDRPETKSALASAIFSSLTRGLFDPRERTSRRGTRGRTFEVQAEPFPPDSTDTATLRALVEGALSLDEAEARLEAFLARDAE